MDNEKNCNTCAHCVYVGDGDYICNTLMTVVLEEFVPSDYFVRGGCKLWQKQR